MNCSCQLSIGYCAAEGYAFTCGQNQAGEQTEFIEQDRSIAKIYTRAFEIGGYAKLGIIKKRFVVLGRWKV